MLPLADFVLINDDVAEEGFHEVNDSQGYDQGIQYRKNEVFIFCQTKTLLKVAFYKLQKLCTYENSTIPKILDISSSKKKHSNISFLKKDKAIKYQHSY